MDQRPIKPQGHRRKVPCWPRESIWHRDNRAASHMLPSWASLRHHVHPALDAGSTPVAEYGTKADLKVAPGQRTRALPKRGP